MEHMITEVDRFKHQIKRSTCTCCPVQLRSAYALSGRKPHPDGAPWDYTFVSADHTESVIAGTLYRADYPHIVAYIREGGVAAYNSVVAMVNGTDEQIFAVGVAAVKCQKMTTGINKKG